MIPINSILNKKVILIILSLFAAQFIDAQNKEKELTTYVTNFLYQNFGEQKTPENYILIDTEKGINKYAFNFKEGGFITVNETKGKYQVLSIVPKGKFTIENNMPLKNKAKKITIDSFKNNTVSKNAKDINETIEPFLTDLWGGVNCFDDNDDMVYPTNYYTPYHCSPGCVAISNCQILHYYEWPIIGVGSNVYSEDYNSSLYRHSTFYDEEAYDWDHMLDNYYNLPSTDQEQRAVGKLMYDMGVAVEMDYEPSGSTNNLNNVPFVLENYFRFSGHYEDASWGSFWNRLHTSMQQHRPVPVAVEATETGDGHVFVANGYKLIDGDPYYYINWGWWNVGPTYNGWYYLQGWTSSSAGYNTIIGAIFDMLPEPQITSVTPNGNGNDFVVQWEVSERLNWSEFTLEQKIDRGAWEEVASGITTKEYTITNPTGNVYQFRVKAKSEGNYYTESWSEVEIYPVAGSYNGFAKFEGTQYAYAKQTPDYDIRFTGDYTFETWINATSNNQSGDIILDQRNVFTLQLSEVTASDYSILFKSYTNSSTTLQSNQNGTKLQADQWHHVAVSKSGTTTKLYIDGELRDSYTGNDLNLGLSNNFLNIGEKYHGSYSGRIVANLDQLRLSKTGRYTANFTPDRTTDFTVDDNTIAYFKFQNKHRIRFKDEAFNLSVRVSNATGNVTWDYEDNTGLSVSEQELFNEILQIFPNPTTDYITIQYTDNDRFKLDDLSFSLFDNTGKELQIEEIDNGFSKRINLESLTPNIYFLTVKSANFRATQKIIKQ